MTIMGHRGVDRVSPLPPSRGGEGRGGGGGGLHPTPASPFPLMKSYLTPLHFPSIVKSPMVPIVARDDDYGDTAVKASPTTVAVEKGSRRLPIDPVSPSPGPFPPPPPLLPSLFYFLLRSTGT